MSGAEPTENPSCPGVCVLHKRREVSEPKGVLVILYFSCCLSRWVSALSCLYSLWDFSGTIRSQTVRESAVMDRYVCLWGCRGQQSSHWWWRHFSTQAPGFFLINLLGRIRRFFRDNHNLKIPFIISHLTFVGLVLSTFPPNILFLPYDASVKQHRRKCPHRPATALFTVWEFTHISLESFSILSSSP